MLANGNSFSFGSGVGSSLIGLILEGATKNAPCLHVFDAGAEAAIQKLGNA